MSSANPPISGPRSANLRQAYDLALAGALGGLFGLYLYVELVHASNLWLRDTLAGVAIGGTLGFVLNRFLPSVCRAHRSTDVHACGKSFNHERACELIGTLIVRHRRQHNRKVTH